MSFTPVLYYDSGQLCTLILDEDYRDGYGIRQDPVTPVVEGVLDPNMVALDGFPITMTRLGSEQGIFVGRFYLPEGLSTVGTYVAVVKWVDPISPQYQRSKTYSVVVGVPFGNASVVGV
ncbi:MAG TPA: hypothetical protein VMX17_06785 [Candidatus Glassbacteria bacterium]|nr:hypothetical protein [Candidatus Glassbacteria bacterium]